MAVVKYLDNWKTYARALEIFHAIHICANCELQTIITFRVDFARHCVKEVKNLFSSEIILSVETRQYGKSHQLWRPAATIFCGHIISEFWSQYDSNINGFPVTNSDTGGHQQFTPSTQAESINLLSATMNLHSNFVLKQTEEVSKLEKNSKRILDRIRVTWTTFFLDRKRPSIIQIQNELGLVIMTSIVQLEGKLARQRYRSSHMNMRTRKIIKFMEPQSGAIIMTGIEMGTVTCGIHTEIAHRSNPMQSNTSRDSGQNQFFFTIMPYNFFIDDDIYIKKSHNWFRSWMLWDVPKASPNRCELFSNL